MWWQGPNSQWYNIQGPSAYITKEGKDILMKRDFTSASGTRQFKSGSPWSHGIKYIWLYVTFTYNEDTAEAFEYFALETGYKTESETDFNIKIRATKVDVERIMHQLGIIEYTVVELDDE